MTTQDKINQINELTGGVIKEYKIEDYPEDGVLHNSFLSKNGDYIGDLDRGWWYVKNNLKVCDDYPMGVAELYEDGNLIGYYGYSHRGGNTFKVGDRLFEERYVPVKEDYDEDQWDKWEKEFNEAWENGDEFDRKMIYTDISAIIPYNLRGSKTIETLEEAKQAAINMSKYLS